MITDKEAINVSVKPSKELISLIKSAIVHAEHFCETWEKIKSQCIVEGITEHRLKEIIKPLLPKEWTKDKRYYFFHREEQIERVQNRKLTTRDLLTKKDEKITQQEMEIRLLRLQLERLKKGDRVLSHEEISQLQRSEEKRRRIEQDLIDWQKEYVKWCEKKAEIIRMLATDLEIKYTILKKPLDTVCIDIFNDLKSNHCIDSDATTTIYDNLPEKYRNLTRQEFQQRVFKALCSS